MLNVIIKVNGIYDILCGLSILNCIPESILSNLHLGMFKRHKIYNYAYFERALSFYIILYGFMRLFGSKLIISTSYISEALYFYNEMVNHDTVYTDKATYVVITSSLLSFACWFL